MNSILVTSLKVLRQKFWAIKEWLNVLLQLVAQRRKKEQPQQKVERKH